MKRLSLLLLCAACCGAQAQVLSNPDQATMNRLGLVLATVQPATADSGTVVSAQVLVSPLQPDALVARFAGVLESWQVAPGDAVEAGAVLGTVHSQEVLQLQQAWLQADAALTLAHNAEARDRRLFDDGIIAARRLQETEQEYAAAKASAAALRAQLTLAGLASGSGFSADSPQLGVYTLRAPMDGTVGRLEVAVGSAISVDQTLLRFGAAQLWLQADLPAPLATGLTIGQRLSVPGVDTPLTLRQIDRQVDRRTQTLGIRAEFDGPVPLHAGEIVSLVLSPTAGGWRIPADAVVHDGAETAVFLRTAAGIERKVLELQPLGADYLAPEGALAGNEQLVVRGASLLKGMVLGLGGE
ncbi:MAG TPA: efflux RND transporter periplasmic adaptor subunit [Hyphomicrobiales bacterium]|nr:efflux RND transporter periplasmic adaptor subunit [Hyphomicrobiales bacterium]